MESPDTIHGRMKEGAHLAGYSLQRAMENLRWLLEDCRYEQLSAGYNNVNDFLRDIQEAFALLNIKPEERKQIAELVKELQPKASQRAIADMVGVSKETIARDLGERENGTFVPNNTVKQQEFGTFAPPAIPPDDYDPIQQERKERKREEKKIARAKIDTDIIDGPMVGTNYQLICEDFRQCTNEVYRLADIIITDPPYSREYLPLYSDLAMFASGVLRPGSLVVVMTGQSYLPEVIERMTAYLTYHWTAAYLTPGGQSPQIWPRKVNTFWKPVLVFASGEYGGKWFGDVCKSNVNDNDKRFHDWGQSESGFIDIVERFTEPGQTVLDPFCGAGTTGLAAIALGRNFIGIDIDDQTINKAAGRMATCKQ